MNVTPVIVGLGAIEMSSNKEFRETVQKTEAFIGALSLYTMVFVVTGLISAFL